MSRTDWRRLYYYSLSFHQTHSGLLTPCVASSRQTQQRPGWHPTGPGLIQDLSVCIIPKGHRVPANVAMELKHRSVPINISSEFGCQTGPELCRKCRWKHVKVRSSWQKFQRGEVAAFIVPVMGRFNRVVAADVPHHVTQRGNGRRFVLDCDADRAVYLKLLHENMDLYGVALIGYCLISNQPCSLGRYPYEG
jgi:hypothetical protein